MDEQLNMAIWAGQRGVSWLCVSGYLWYCSVSLLNHMSDVCCTSFCPIFLVFYSEPFVSSSLFLSFVIIFKMLNGQTRAQTICC